MTYFLENVLTLIRLGVLRVLFSGGRVNLTPPSLTQKSKKLMKVPNIDRDILHNFWTTWGNSMKFSGKIWLMIILKVTRKPGFFPLFRRYNFRKTTSVGDQIEPPAPLRLNKRYVAKYEFSRQGIWRLLYLHNFFWMFISFACNKFSRSNTDSCANLKNISQIMGRLTISTSAKWNNNTVQKMANKNGQSLKQLITNSHLSE